MAAAQVLVTAEAEAETISAADDDVEGMEEQEAAVIAAADSLGFDCIRRTR